MNAGTIGYAWCVYKDGQKVAGGAHGWARAPWEPNDPSWPMTIDCRTQLASVSKTICACGMMKLWEDGKFDLDEPFWPYLKKVVPTATPEVKKITFRQLLTHRSGINRGFRPRGGSYESLINAINQIANAPLDFPTGSKQKYDNGNFLVLRLLIEEISGEPFTEYIQKNIFDPIGIYNITCWANERHPTMYYIKDNFETPGGCWTRDNSPTAGPDSWLASARDLARYVDGINRGMALKKETVNKMWTEGLGWWPHRGKYGINYHHNGLWNTNRDGGVVTGAIAFADGTSATLLINCKGYDTIGLLIRAYERGFAHYNAPQPAATK